MSFERAVADHKDAVYRQMLRTSRDLEGAEQSLIEALVAAQELLSKAEDQGEYRAWLALLGSRIQGRFGDLAQLEPLFSLVDPVQLTLIEDSEGESGNGFDMVACLDATLDSIPRPFHKAYVRRDLEGRKLEEAAAEIGITVAALKSRLPLAREIVRKSLDEGLKGLTDLSDHEDVG